MSGQYWGPAPDVCDARVRDATICARILSAGSAHIRNGWTPWHLAATWDLNACVEAIDPTSREYGTIGRVNAIGALVKASGEYASEENGFDLLPDVVLGALTYALQAMSDVEIAQALDGLADSGYLAYYLSDYPDSGDCAGEHGHPSDCLDGATPGWDPFDSHAQLMLYGCVAGDWSSDPEFECAPASRGEIADLVQLSDNEAAEHDAVIVNSWAISRGGSDRVFYRDAGEPVADLFARAASLAVQDANAWRKRAERAREALAGVSA